jgi:hypothetical protein
MPIITKDSENRCNKESKLNNSIYISRAIVGDKTLKNT